MEIKLLIVDDEESITNSLTKYFELMGYDVTSTTSPLEALEIIYKENYMVVISDIMMPEMNGIELLKKIKKFNGMIQVIMMTGVVTIENVLACLKNGANDCFLKPLDDMEDLRLAVESSADKLRKWENLIKTMVHRKA